MQFSTVALLALVAAASAQTPPGCQTSFSGTFEFSPVNVTGSSKRDLNIYKRQSQTCTSTPVVTLSNGKFIDQQGRTGEIVANEQFQFDPQTQSGALFTSGWSICSNGTLAIGGSAIFYSCNSGSFNNLYHESVGAQCFQVYIDTIPCVGPSGSAPPVTASSTPLTTIASSAVSSAGSTSTPVATTAPTSTALSSTALSSTALTSAAPSSAAPFTMTMAAPAPFPVANSTSATGTAVGTISSSKTATSAPATFTAGSGATTLAAGSKLVAAMVGLAVLTMF